MAGIGQEHSENFVLRGRYPDRVSTDQQLLGVQVQGNVSHLEPAFRVGLPDGPQGIIAPQQGLHTGQQFLLIEGLHQIIVRPGFQAQDPVGPLRLGGEHEDGHVAVLPDAHSGQQAAAPGHHHVHDNKVGLLHFRQTAGFLSVPGGADPIACLGQGGFQNVHDGGIVIHRQNLVGLLHSVTSLCFCTQCIIFPQKAQCFPVDSSFQSVLCVI